MNNVMWMSDSFNAPSGFGQQTFHIVSRLTSGPNPIHIDNVGWQWAGNPALLNDNWRVLPTGGRFAAGILSHHMKIYKPDLLITLADLWNVQHVINMRRHYDFKWLQWLPIDGTPISDVKWTSSYNGVDVLMAMSDFGYKELVDGKKAWVEKLERDEPWTQIEKIYHGIPVDIFRPYDEDHRKRLRTEYNWQDDFLFDTEIRMDFVKGEKNLDDYFIFGIVARNQPRKNYPWLLQAWKEFAESHEDERVLLWIHACPSDTAGHNLHFIADQLGITDSVVFSDTVSQWYGKSSAEMADVYNLFDCHFLPTAGEGFGIPTVEAMACGIYTAVTDFTTGNELLDGGKAGHIMHCDRTSIDPGHVLRVKYNMEEIVDYLEEVYNTPESTRKRKALLARKRAEERYDITKIASQWRDIIDKYAAEAPNPKVRTLDLQLHYNPAYMRVREADAQVEYAKNEYRFIGRYLEEGDSVFEIGCGSGEGMIFLSRHFGVLCQGIDISEHAVKMCRKKGLYVEQADFSEYLPYVSDAFDMVFSQHVVEHIFDDTAAISRSINMARKYAIHTVPHDNMRDTSHLRPYTEESVRELMNRIKNNYDELHGEPLKIYLHKNFVGDSNYRHNLVSYVMVFEKEQIE